MSPKDGLRSFYGRLGLNDAHKFVGLERSTPDEVAVNVLHLLERATIIPVDATPVDNPEVFSDSLGYLACNKLPDVLVNLLGLLWRRDNPGADGPGWTRNAW